MANDIDRPTDPLLTGGFLLNVNLVFLTTVVSYLLSFAVTIVVSRALGPEGRGLTALYQQAVNFGFTLLSLGIGAAAVYFVSRRELTARQALECGLSITLAATAVTALTLGALTVAFKDELSGTDLPYWLALVALPGVIQFHTIVTVLRGQGRFAAMSAVELLHPVIAITALLIIEWTSGLTVSGAVFVWSLSFLAPIVLGYGLLGVAAWPRRLAGRTLLLPAVRFGVQGQLSNLLQLLNYRLDAYLVLIFVSSAGVGIYANSVALSEGMWFIANSVAVVLLTEITGGGPEHAARMTPIVCRNTLLVTAIAAIAAAATAPFVVPLLFGSSFEDAVLPFLCLLPGTVALAGGKILSAYVFSRGKPIINAWIALGTLIVTLAADVILIPAFEVAGAAAAASIAYVFSLALTAYAYRRLSGNAIAEALIPRPSDATLYIDGISSLVRRLSPAHTAR